MEHKLDDADNIVNDIKLDTTVDICLKSLRRCTSDGKVLHELNRSIIFVATDSETRDPKDQKIAGQMIVGNKFAVQRILKGLLEEMEDD